MKKIFGSILDIRRGEVLLTSLMLSNYFLILVTYYFLKPARDSLFLTKVSSEQLPIVFILTALVAAPIITLYSRAGRSLRLNQQILVTFGVIIINLLILRWLIQINQPWVYYLFYVWVSIYGALTTSQFWLLSNAVFDASQAKRIFPLLGLGGILGAFLGGEITGIIVTSLNVATENLLFFCMGFLAVTGLLGIAIWSIKSKTEERQRRIPRSTEPSGEKLGQTFKSIYSNRHLAMLVGIIAMTMMVASFVDYQFKFVARETFEETSELTAFLGQFYGRLSLVSLVLQLLLTYRFIRWLGVGGVILFLPLALAAGSVTMMVMPGLLAAILLRGGDGALKYSIDKTGRELLFLPIPLELKKRTKVFIDIVVDRGFRGLAGALLLLCIALNLTVRQMSAMVILLLIIWLVFVIFMRREYVDSFRKALEKRSIDPGEMRANIDDAAAVNALITSLGSENERQVNYALEMLMSAKGVELVWPVKALLQHKSPEVRRRAIVLLKAHGDKSLDAEIKGLLGDADVDVRTEAIHYLCLKSDRGVLEELQTWLGHDVPDIRVAALSCIARYGDEEHKRLLSERLIESIMDNKSTGAEEGRRQLALAFGSINAPVFSRYFYRLLNDDSPEVVTAAIRSVGISKDEKFVPWLLDHMADKDYRAAARTALVNFGETIFDTLENYLLDARGKFIIRKNIPRIFAGIPAQKSVDVLTANLDKIEPSLKYYMVKALNRLRSDYPGLKFNDQRLATLVIEETRGYYEIMRTLHLQDYHDHSQPTALLCRALQERQQQYLERVFRLLGLVYPPQDIYNAYQGIVSGKKLLYANAVEFLDNLLQTNVKKYILPILDIQSVESVLEKAAQLFKIDRKDREAALLQLIDGNDNWLKSCAIYSALDHSSDKIREAIEKAAADPDPLVSETANLVAGKLGR